MNEEKNHLKDIKSYYKIYVLSGDGSKGKIISKRKLDYPGLPCLNGVLLVDGITSNLISISKLCNRYLYANFNRAECTVIHKHHAQLMKGSNST